MRFYRTAADGSHRRQEQISENPLTGAPIVGVWLLDAGGRSVCVLGPLPPAPWWEDVAGLVAYAQRQL